MPDWRDWRDANSRQMDACLLAGQPLSEPRCERCLDPLDEINTEGDRQYCPACLDDWRRLNRERRDG